MIVRNSPTSASAYQVGRVHCAKPETSTQDHVCIMTYTRTRKTQCSDLNMNVNMEHVYFVLRSTARLKNTMVKAKFSYTQLDRPQT